MKNVTIAIDDETQRRARIRAAEMGTSLSALVKRYLQQLADEPINEGVREMPTSFAHHSVAANPVPNPDNAPYFVNGKWVFTKDGKPRKPGALKGKINMADDFMTTPEWLIDAFYGIDSQLPPPE